MSGGGARFQTAGQPIVPDRFGSASAMAELFLPLYRLLGSGGDPRLAIDPESGLNQYGCQPFPCPDTLSFASSTATSISQRAYDRASRARESLMRSAIAVGLDEAFDARIEAMRGELKSHLGLSGTAAEVVFSPSGTDAQLQALFLARARLGSELTTIVVAADQTGSGTAETARGRHFGAVTANGTPVEKGQPVAGLGDGVASVMLALFDENGNAVPVAESDASILAAVERSVANGTNVLLQIMDSSKLGWRAPSDPCLDEISRRWPDRVQVVVDACQMRLGRPRLRKYLELGYLVIVTGSKFFTGPPFSGALLVPACLSETFDATGVALGLCDYSSRCDWPISWPALRSRFPVRRNFGQWLRWEAALEEIRAYYSVPDEFRMRALATFGEGVQRIIASSPSLRLLPRPQNPAGGSLDDEELAQPTIFAFVLQRGGCVVSPDDCRKVYRALSRDAGCAGQGHDKAEIAATVCLVGQPVVLGRSAPAAALRICAGARLVTGAWSSETNTARGSLWRELGQVGAIVAKIEWLLAHPDGAGRQEDRR
jgi:hypothetical protein